MIGVRGTEAVVRGPSIFFSLLLLASAAFAQTPAAPPELVAVIEMVESGRAADAERALRAILDAQDSPVARDLLGVVLSRQGRLQQAEEQFRRALDLDRRFPAAQQHLARLYLQQQRPKEALTALRAAAELGPLERDLAFELAAAEIAAGQPEAAERQLLSIVERFESVRALLDLAKLQSRRGDSAAAAAHLQQALAIAPNSEEVLSALARVSLAERTPVPAIRALEPLTRMHPSVADHAYLLGIARLQIGDYDGAVATLKRALELEPDRGKILTALGLAFNDQKQFTEAREVLRRSLGLAPESIEALAALAEAEEGLGLLEEAERHAGAALARAGDHAGAHLVIGKVRMNQQRYEEARDALERAVASDPTSSKAHYQLSLAYARLGDSERSARHLESYRKALREAEEYLIELRTKAGLGVSGMGR